MLRLDSFVDDVRFRGGTAYLTDAGAPALIVLDPHTGKGRRVRCDGCIALHTAEARKHGATPEELAKALGVTVTVNAGAALVYSARTLDAFGA